MALADQDPSMWLPPAKSARCQYIGKWTPVEFRWGLAVDTIKQAALEEVASGSPNEPITVNTSPTAQTEVMTFPRSAAKRGQHQAAATAS